MASVGTDSGPRLPQPDLRAGFTPLAYGRWDKLLVDYGYRPKDDWPVRVVWHPEDSVRPVFDSRNDPSVVSPFGRPLTYFQDVIWVIDLPSSAPIYVRQTEESRFFEEQLVGLEGSGGVVSEWEAAAVVVAYGAIPDEVEPPLREAVVRFRGKEKYDAIAGQSPRDSRPAGAARPPAGGPVVGATPAGRAAECPLRFGADGQTLEGLQPDGTFAPLALADPQKPLTRAMVTNLHILIGNHSKDVPDALSGSYSDTLSKAVERVPGLAAYLDRPGKAGGGPSGRIRLRRPGSAAGSTPENGEIARDSSRD